MTKPILCLDFDGVIHSYSSGWQGAHIVSDPPVPGAIEFMCRASDHFTVAVYSSRSSQPGGINAMQQYICEHMYRELRAGSNDSDLDIKQAPGYAWFYRLLWPTSKPSAMITIDDRAITFTGAWPRIEDLLDFQPWNKVDRDGKVRHTRAILNVDAPKYMDLERRYYEALRLLCSAVRLPGSEMEQKVTAVLNAAAAKHPIRLKTVLRDDGAPEKGEMVDGFELIGTD